MIVGGPSIPTNEPTMQAHYDLVGNKQYETDLHSNTTTYKYDWLFRVTDVHLPLSGSYVTVPPDQLTTYDRVGNTLSQSDADDHVTKYTYDAANRLLTQTDPVGNEVDYQYDPNGNVILETHKSPLDESNPTGAKVTTLTITTPSAKIDGLDRPGEVDETVYLGDPTGGAQQVTYVTTYDYSLDAQNTVIVTDPRGNSADPEHVSGKTETVLDGLDRVHSATVDVGGLGLTTTTQYDQDGDAVKITDPSGTFVVNTYDGLGRMLTSKDELNPAEAVFYNGNDDVVKQVDKRGTVTTTTYDNLNRVLNQTLYEQFSNGGQQLTLSATSYNDPANQVTTTDADGNATVTQFDAVGRPVLVTEPGVPVTDPGTQATTFVHPTIVSVYDGVNLRSQTDANHNVTLYQYDADNRLIETDEDGTTGGAITTTLEEYHDAQNQVIDVGPRIVNGADPHHPPERLAGPGDFAERAEQRTVVRLRHQHGDAGADAVRRRRQRDRVLRRRQ